MDVPSIEIAVAVCGGVVFGALLTAVAAGLNALGEAGLHAVAESGGAEAPTAERVLASGGAVRARLLVGRVVFFTLAAAAAGYGAYMRWGLWPALGWVCGVAFLYIAVSAVASVVARRRSTAVPLRLMRWLRPLEWVLAPLAAPIVALEKAASALLPDREPVNQERMTELTVEHVIDVGEETGSLGQDQAQLLRSVLEFKNTVVREIMVPRGQVVALDLKATTTDVLDAITQSEHSRYPVYRDAIDQIEGVLYAKDLFQLMGGSQEAHVDIAKVVRTPAFFTAETQKIGTVLREMQSRRSHLAVVVDEFGGMSGIVTLEDILEEIVGEIQDEHDEEPVAVLERSPGHYIVDAGESIYDLEKRLGEPICEDKTDFDTVGGMVVHLAGRVPTVGEQLSTGAFDVVVLDADERRVTRVEVVRSRQ